MQRVLAAAVLVAPLGFAPGCASAPRRAPEPPAIHVGPVTTRDLALHLYADGLTRALERALAADSAVRWVPPGPAAPPEGPEVRSAPAGALRLTAAVDRRAGDTLRVVWALYDGPQAENLAGGVAFVTPTQAHAAMRDIARRAAAAARARQPGV